jgi:hypothetical protein
MCKTLTLILFSFVVLADSPEEEKNLRADFNREFAAAKKDPKQYAELIMGVQLLLAKLGYGTTFTGDLDDYTKRALKEYQRYNGLPVTGEMNFETFQKVNADSVVSSKDAVMLPPSESSLESWDKGYVSVSGTWLNAGEDDIPMPQASQISCFKDLGICLESQAVVFKGMLKADEDLYEIERWDNLEIVTKPIQGTCTRTITRINRSQSLVTSIRSKISKQSASGFVAYIIFLHPAHHQRMSS